MSTTRQQPVYVNVNSDYTMLDSLLYGQFPVEEIRLVVDTSSGPINITLPDSANINNVFPKVLIIDSTGDAASNNITITASGSDTINSSTTQIISTANGCVRLDMYESGKWGAIYVTAGVPFTAFQSKLVYVDGTYGDDATGLAYRIDKAFKTIAAAEAAAKSGDTLLIYPGTYTDQGLGKNNVNYYYYAGASLTSANTCYNDSLGAIAIRIDGFGDFSSTAGIAFSFDNGSQVFLRGRTITGGTQAIALGKGALMTVNLISDITTAAGNGIVLTDAATKLFLTCRNLYASATALAMVGTSTTYVSVNCNEIRSTGNAADAIAINNVGSTAFITANVISKTQATADVACVQIHPAAPAGTYMKIVANISTGALTRAYILANGTMELHGNISGGGTGLVTGSDTIHKHYGDIDANTEARAGITMSGGSMVYAGRMRNLHNSVGANGITKSSGTMIVAQNTTIVLTAGGAECLTGTAGQPFKVYPGVVSNSIVNAGVVEQVDNVLVSADVV